MLMWFIIKARIYRTCTVSGLDNFQLLIMQSYLDRTVLYIYIYVYTIDTVLKCKVGTTHYDTYVYSQWSTGCVHWMCSSYYPQIRDIKVLWLTEELSAQLKIRRSDLRSSTPCHKDKVHHPALLDFLLENGSQRRGLRALVKVKEKYGIVRQSG